MRRARRRSPHSPRALVFRRRRLGGSHQARFLRLPSIGVLPQASLNASLSAPSAPASTSRAAVAASPLAKHAAVPAALVPAVRGGPSRQSWFRLRRNPGRSGRGLLRPRAHGEDDRRGRHILFDQGLSRPRVDDVPRPRVRFRSPEAASSKAQALNSVRRACRAAAPAGKTKPPRSLGPFLGHHITTVFGVNSRAEPSVPREGRARHGHRRDGPRAQHPHGLDGRSTFRRSGI